MTFHFKKFHIEDERSSMKVGTDAVLLGAWADAANPAHILDVGMGSGIIALMMAQRFPGAIVHGIDIHEGSVKEAKENFRNSPWPERFEALLSSLQEFVKTGRNYDLIVSNPPFFVNALPPPDQERRMARHTATLSPEDLMEATAQMLTPKGNFSLICPHSNLPIMERQASRIGLYKTRQCDIIPVSGKKANRSLTSWSFSQKDLIYDSITIRQDENAFTQEYRKLTKDFYLAL